MVIDIDTSSAQLKEIRLVTADDDAGGAAAPESAHRSEPSFEPSVIRVLLEAMKHVRRELIDRHAQCRRSGGDHLDRFTVIAECRFKTSTSMIGPCWSRSVDVAPRSPTFM